MIGKIRKKFKNKLKDKDFSEIFKKSRSGFLISTIGRPLGLIQQLVITNFFGAAAFGVFRVCFSLLSLVGIAGRFGVDMAISRFVAQYRKQNRYDLINEIFQMGIRLVLPIALFLSLLLFFGAPTLTHYVYHDKPYVLPIQIFSFGIFFFILSGVIEEGIRGLKKIQAYSWINNVSTQAVATVLLLICILFTTDPMAVNITYVIGLGITFLLGAWYWLKYVPYQKIINPELSKRELLNVSVPMLSAKYLTTLYTWLGTLILAAYVSDDQVGIFAGASRLTAFATMPLIAINNITGPKFAEAFGENDDKYLKKTVKLSTRLIFWSCMPIMLLFFLLPKLLMSMYGPEFITRDAILAFHIINFGQLVNFMTGPVTVLLNMTGRQKVTQRYAAITTVTSIGLSYAFIPSMGIIGAALATSIARTVLNLGCALHIYFTMGINMIYNPFSDLMNLLNRKNKREIKSDTEENKEQEHD